GHRLRSGARHADAARRMNARGIGMAMIQRLFVAALAVVATGCLASAAAAPDRLRIALQRTGTASWEIEVIKARGLDKAANLDLEVTELASTAAGKIAIEGGSADLVVEDWLWAARERSLGDKLLFTPYSTALGAVMAPKDSPVHKIADLAARSTRAGSFCARPRSLGAMTSPRTRGPHTGRRRSSPRSSLKERPRRRSN